MMHTWRLMKVMGEARGGGQGVIKKRRKGNVPIGHTGDGAFLELHHVAGQGPRLVSENVFHLYG